MSVRKSGPFEISTTDVQDVLWRGLVVVAGAALTYVATSVVPLLQTSGSMTQLALAVILTGLVDLGKQYLTDSRTDVEKLTDAAAKFDMHVEETDDGVTVKKS